MRALVLLLALVMQVLLWPACARAGTGPAVLAAAASVDLLPAGRLFRDGGGPFPPTPPARRSSPHGPHRWRRPLDHAALRRHRPGTGDLQGTGGADGRRYPGRQHGGGGFALRLHAAAGRRQRAARPARGQGARRLGAGAPVRPGGGRRPTRAHRAAAGPQRRAPGACRPGLHAGRAAPATSAPPACTSWPAPSRRWRVPGCSAKRKPASASSNWRSARSSPQPERPARSCSRSCKWSCKIGR
jgi:hypothetical protein